MKLQYINKTKMSWATKKISEFCDFNGCDIYKLHINETGFCDGFLFTHPLSSRDFHVRTEPSSCGDQFASVICLETGKNTVIPNPQDFERLVFGDTRKLRNIEMVTQIIDQSHNVTEQPIKKKEIFSYANALRQK